MPQGSKFHQCLVPRPVDLDWAARVGMGAQLVKKARKAIFHHLNGLKILRNKLGDRLIA
ncbi:hypothetical protein SC1_02153 [Sphingopyxis sp. C-1]|nr:hypothetical protein SC1_02153 [Sphingopyxis sp. C-1]